MNQAVSLATKGVIGCKGVSLATKGVILLCIVETPLRRRKGVGISSEKKRKLVTVFYNYDNQLYEFKQIVDETTVVTLQDINVEIIDSKPIVTFKMID